MRKIGHLENETAARTLSDYLYVKGIKNQIESEPDGTWGLWIHAEDELEPARALLESFRVNPADPKIQRAAQQAAELKAGEQAQAAQDQKRYFDRDRIFPGAGFLGMGPLTFGLIAFSVIVYLVREYTPAAWLTDYLFISDPFSFDRSLPEVREGQIWRLITPIFLHASFPLHILFNMLWLRDLGTMIESRLGTWMLALLVVTIAVASNLAQYFAYGPNFLGMSGVVYGLLGYIWIRGKFDPGSGLFLHPTTVMMMLVWLVLGYTSVMPMAVANTVHVVGLGVGVVWGFLAAQLRRR